MSDSVNVQTFLFLYLLCFWYNLVYSRTVHHQGHISTRETFIKVFPFYIYFDFFTDMNSSDIRAIFLYKYKLGSNAAKVEGNIHAACGDNTFND